MVYQKDDQECCGIVINRFVHRSLRFQRHFLILNVLNRHIRFPQPNPRSTDVVFSRLAGSIDSQTPVNSLSVVYPLGQITVVKVL